MTELCKSSPSFLRTQKLHFKSMHWLYSGVRIKQSIAYLCCLLRYRISIALSTLDCFKVLTLWMSDTLLIHSYCLNTSVTWCRWQTYSDREQVALERASIVYWSVLSLWEGLMGARGSFIKLTPGVTHGAEAAASKHCNASMNTFSFFVCLS